MLVNEIIFLEAKAMLKYALGNGLKVPNDVVENIKNYQDKIANKIEENTHIDQDHDTILLNKAHNQLCKLVSPARPSTLGLFYQEEKKSFFLFLGPVPLIRYMILIAIIALISLICLGISPYVDGTPQSFSLLHNDGTPLLLNQLFLISASAMGASFAVLFQVNTYIRNATFDPMYESTYWVRFVLGILAGTMLATLIPLEHIQNENSMTQGFGQPLLALLGGFSASVVFRILTRFTTALETIFKGDMKEMIASKELTNNMRLEQQNMQNKLQLLNQLETLQKKISSGSDSKALLDELTQIQKQLLDV